MKATLEGTFAGAGGKQHIKIAGDLSIDGFTPAPVPTDLSAIVIKLGAMEAEVLSLKTQLAALQAQNLQASVKELGAALEALKTPAAPSAPEPQKQQPERNDRAEQHHSGSVKKK